MIVDRARVAEALPGYELGEELGRGAFGLVLAARHRRLGRQVAVKVLTADGAVPGQMEQQFLAEAQLLSGLDHPHIVRLHDYVEHRGVCVLVMERLAGGSLAAREPARSSLEYACGFGLAVSDALHTAHQHRILHRDIKPDNLLFGADGTVKVTDFGIAKLFEGTEARSTSFIGSPTYMAPEQAALGRIGPATDVYSLNVVLYQLFTGRMLFPRDLPPAAMLLQHMNEQPRPMTDVPDEVAAVVLRGLAKSIDDRQPTARAFGLELATAAARSLGAGWLARAQMPLRIDEELRDAARSMSPSSQVTERRSVFQRPLLPPGSFRALPTGPAPEPAGAAPSPYVPFPADRSRAGPAPGPVSADPVVPTSGAPEWTGPVVVPATPAWLMSGQLRRPSRWNGRRRFVAAAVAAVVALSGAAAIGFGMHTFSVQPVEHTAAGPGAVAASGDTLYVTDPDHDQVRRMRIKAPGSTVTNDVVAAGNGKPGFSGDGGRAVAARLDDPGGLAVDAAGNLYIADLGNHRVRKVDRAGTITTVAGGGSGPVEAGSSADQVELSTPFSIAVSSQGTLWIAEQSRHQVSKVAATGRMEIVAGTGRRGFSGDGKAAARAQLDGPDAIAVTPDGAWLYIGDQGNGRVRSVRLGTGIIDTFAGDGTDGPMINDRLADTVSLHGVYSLAVAPDGGVYIGGESLRRVRQGAIDAVATPTTTSVSVDADGRLFMVTLESASADGLARRLYTLRPGGTLSRLAW